VATRRRLGALFVENFAQKHRPGRASAVFSARVRESPAGLSEDPARRCNAVASACTCARGKKNGEDARRFPRHRCCRLPSGPPHHSSTATAPSFPANFFQMLAPSARSTPELSSSFSLLSPFVPLSGTLSLFYHFTTSLHCPSFVPFHRAHSASFTFVPFPSSFQRSLFCFLPLFVLEEQPCGRARREKGRQGREQ